MDIIKDQLKEVSHLLNKIIDDKLVINSISEASQIMINSIKSYSCFVDVSIMIRLLDFIDIF